MMKRKNNRVPGYDYSTPGVYFVTFCTADRKHILWEQETQGIQMPEDVPLSAAGKIVKEQIERIPQVYPGTILHRYVVMPNHVHILLGISSDRENISLSAIIMQTKRTISKSTGSIWQKSYYDHIIRVPQDFQTKYNYIESNPGKWTEDAYYGINDQQKER